MSPLIFIVHSEMPHIIPSTLGQLKVLFGTLINREIWYKYVLKWVHFCKIFLVFTILLPVWPKNFLLILKISGSLTSSQARPSLFFWSPFGPHRTEIPSNPTSYISVNSYTRKEGTTDTTNLNFCTWKTMTILILDNDKNQ